MDVKSISIDEIGLSRRSCNALHRAGIGTVGEMLEHTSKSLSGIRNMGQKSIDEVLLKISEYRKYDSEGGLPEMAGLDTAHLPDIPEDFVRWCETEEGRSFISKWLEERHMKIDVLDLLSARAYNILMLNGKEDLGKVIFLSPDELMEIPRMDRVSADETARLCCFFLKDHEAEILDALQKKHEEAAQDHSVPLKDLLYSMGMRGRLLQYVKANDCDVKSIGFSVRTENRLMGRGFLKISDFIFVPTADLKEIKGMGETSLKEIRTFIDGYLAKHESRIRLFLDGDNSALQEEKAWNAEIIRDGVLDTYNRIGFKGLSLREMREEMELPEVVTDEVLKSVIGNLLADGSLEYVDFRCYRLYPKIIDYIPRCSGMKERTKEILVRRLRGETLENIASSVELTREGVRQIVSKNMLKIKGLYRSDTGMEWFDEDYYRYFYETYAIDKKDAGQWLGIGTEVFLYLDLIGAEKGTRDLQEAEDDYKHLDLGLRLKINNYLNRNKLYLDGRWIEKRRDDLERYVVWKYCREGVSFDEFIRLYNALLKEEEVPFDEGLYITDSAKKSREHKLSNDTFLLWRLNKQLRYYDIDGQDFSELLDVLNLDAYENIEYSTAKFMRDYPDIMEKYDIRDQYELHNLLRKIVKEGDYHDFHCDRTPMIRFGSFDRNSAILDMIIDNAPVTQADLAELLSQEYGYEPSTVIGTYLYPFSAYYHQGIYTVDQKVMLSRNQEALLAELTEDFYYIDEIRKKYARVVHDADLEEINPYTLKSMGFSVLSRYVYRNHSTLDGYFRHLLTKEDITDIRPYRRRFAYVVSFSGTLIGLKRSLEILEFEPDKIICFRKLAAAGITREDLLSFCDEVDDYVEDGTYFSIQSIRADGFESELFDLGFSEWFYASLLTSDGGFSNTRAFGNIILYKGQKRISIQSFEESLIREHGSIDVYDLMTEMVEKYGCKISDRLDPIYKLNGSDVYYDRYRDWLYASKGIFDREVDAAEGL